MFSRGGYELNPVVRGLIHFTGPVLGVFISKAFLLSLVWRFSQRNWILYLGNVFYSGIVAWNLLMFVLGS